MADACDAAAPAVQDRTARIPATAGTLPPGTTVNPSVGAGLGVCTPAQYASETTEWSAATGCPSTSKIGEFRLHSPLYREWIGRGWASGELHPGVWANVGTPDELARLDRQLHSQARDGSAQ